MLVEAGDPDAGVADFEPADFGQRRRKPIDAHSPVQRSRRHAGQVAVGRVIVRDAPQPIQPSDHRRLGQAEQVAEPHDSRVIPQVRPHLDPGHAWLPYCVSGRGAG